MINFQIQNKTPEPPAIPCTRRLQKKTNKRKNLAAILFISCNETKYVYHGNAPKACARR